MISPEDEEAAWTLIMMRYSVPSGTKMSVVEALEREDRVFVRFPRRRRTFRAIIYSPSSTPIVESATKEDPLKIDILDGPMMEHPTEPTRNRKKCLHLLLSIEQQRKGTKCKANGCSEAEAFSSRRREPTPEWLVQLMKVKDGKSPKKIIEKELTATDVKSNNNRLSIPVSQIVDREFLSSTEERKIDEQSRKINKEGVKAILVASDREEFALNLRLWDMGKCPVYNLITGWNKVVRHYQLKEKDKIHLWSFHADGKLYFALVPPSAQ